VSYDNFVFPRFFFFQNWLPSRDMKNTVRGFAERILTRSHVVVSKLTLDRMTQEWDTYLTEYASSLPNTRDRAGIFRPLSYSFWDRLFPWMHRPKPSAPSDYPFPVDMKHPASPRLSFDYTLQDTPSVDRLVMPKTFTSDASPRPLRQQSQDPLARPRIKEH
jgi:hypothetical protein